MLKMINRLAEAVNSSNVTDIRAAFPDLVLNAEVLFSLSWKGQQMKDSSSSTAGFSRCVGLQLLEFLLGIIVSQDRAMPFHSNLEYPYYRFICLICSLPLCPVEYLRILTIIKMENANQMGKKN